jgi:hypothetical protein
MLFTYKIEELTHKIVCKVTGSSKILVRLSAPVNHCTENLINLFKHRVQLQKPYPKIVNLRFDKNVKHR